MGTIRFCNGGSIDAFDSKYVAARGNSKPAATIIQLLELCHGIKFTEEEKVEIFSVFYGGENND